MEKTKEANIDLIYKSIKNVFKSMRVVGLWDEEREKKMIDRLFVLYQMAKKGKT